MSIMADQLLKLALLLLLVSCSSSMGTTDRSNLVETNSDSEPFVVPMKVVDTAIISNMVDFKSGESLQDPKSFVTAMKDVNPTTNFNLMDSKSGESLQDRKPFVATIKDVDPTTNLNLVDSKSSESFQDLKFFVAPMKDVDPTTNFNLVDSKSSGSLQDLKSFVAPMKDVNPTTNFNLVDSIRNSTANVPAVAELNENESSDKVTTLVSTMSEGTMTTLASTIESKVIPEQEAGPTVATSQEEASTSKTDVMTTVSATSEDPSRVTFSLQPVNDHFTFPSYLPTSQEDDKANDPEVTSFHPSSTTTRIPKTVATKAPKMESTTTKKPEESSSKKMKQVTLIVIVIVILILILITAIVVMVRCKRRRGSQNFGSQSRSSKKAEVWAGQVPDLGDEKMTPHPMATENGTSHKAESGQEQEMTTFISSEKKDDSLIEVDELLKEDDWKKPLLEEMNEEPEKLPEEEQIPAPTMEQELL